MQSCLKCGEVLQGLDYLQGFEFRFCSRCLTIEHYDDLEFLDETLDEEEDDDDDD